MDSKSKKYQVFISSTYADLVEERRKVLDILLMADCIPSGMEAFVATDNEQFEVIKKVIDLCDYYVLIIGKRYGSINPSTGISYTEMEYDYAKAQGIPVLVFVIDESVILPGDKCETDSDKADKLSKFREKAMGNRLATIWKSAEGLTGALAISIMRAKSEIVRPGWQRATDYDEASLRREMMELQNSNNGLEKELNNAKNTIIMLTKQNDVAFVGCEIQIDFYYFEESRLQYKRIDKTKIVNLQEIFVIIATEMMDISIVEEKAKELILEKLCGSKDIYHLKDSQLIKRIMNQLRALDLVYSEVAKGRFVPFWGLTTKGVKTRDDMILIRDATQYINPDH